MTIAVGVSGVECAASEGKICTGSREGAAGSGPFGGLGSGTRIQFYRNWLKDKLFWLFPYFFSTALLSQHWGDYFFLFPWTDSSTNI